MEPLDGPSSALKSSAGIARRALRASWRVTKWLLKTLGVLVGLLLLLLALVQLTESGRALVLDTALRQTNALIPGTIEAKRLGRLSLFGVELWDVKVVDPKGNQVIAVGHLRIDTDVSGLLRGKIALDLLQLDHARVDARREGPGVGIVGAFVDPNEPASPPSPGPPPDILVQRIEIRDVEGHLPSLEPLGAVDLRLTKFVGDFTLVSGGPRAKIEELQMLVRRDGEEILSATASAHLHPGKTPAHLKLEARSGEIELAVDARAVLPPEPGWEEEAAHAKVEVRGVTAERLAFLLRDPSLEDAFLGEVGLELSASGTSSHLEGSGQVTTQAGDLQLSKLGLRGDELSAVLSSEGIRLQELRSDLPPHEVALEVSAETRGLPPEPVAAKISIRRWVVDQVALFDVDCSGVLEGADVRDLKVQARRGDSRIEVEGSMTGRGAAAVHARLDLRERDVQELGQLVGQEVSGRLLLNAKLQRDEKGHVSTQGNAEVQNLSQPGTDKEGGISLEEAKIVFSAQGTPPAITGRVEGDVQKLRAGDHYVDEARLVASGSAESMHLRLVASGGAGPPGPDGSRPQKQATSVDLDADVQRSGTETTVSARGTASFEGTEMELDVAPTRVSDSGKIETEGLEVRVAGQPITVTGGLSPDGTSEGIELRFGPLRLDSIPQIVAQVPDISGVAAGRVRIEGSTQVPIVEFEIEGAELGLRDRPLSSLDLRGRLDAKSGGAEVELQVKSQAGLSANTEVAWSFSPGPEYVAALPQGSGSARLHVKQLTTEFVAPYLGESAALPDAQLGSTVVFQGSLAEPRLKADSAVALLLGQERVGKVRHTLEYEAGRLETEVDVDDAEGPWLKGELELDLGQAFAASELADAFAKAPTSAQWRLRLETQGRDLQTISLLPLATNPSDLPPLHFKTVLSARHAPQSEPEIDLVAHIKQQLSGEKGDWSSGNCGPERVLVAVRAKHRGSSNELVVTSRDRQQKLLDLRAHMPMELQPVLRGEAPRLGRLDLEVRAEELDLARLPVICQQARGTVSVEATGSDLLGKRPELDLKLRGAGLSAGTKDPLDLELKAHANSSEVSVEGTLQGNGRHQKARGSLGGRLPWKFSEAKLSIEESAPLDARLRLSKMPLAPLVPERGEISYARGTLDVDVRAAGKLNAPELQGDIRLRDIGFTETSMAQPLRDIQGEIQLRGRRVLIEHVEARDRDGLLTLGGEIDWKDLNDLKARIEIEAEDFPLRQQGQVVAVTNFQATATTRVTDERTDAKLELKDVDTWLESVTARSGITLDAHPDFVVDSEDSSEKEPSDAPGEPGRAAGREADEEKEAGEDGAAITTTDEGGRLVSITIDARNRFWVKREDFAVKLSALLQTEIVQDEVRVQGDVTIDRGYLQLFGKVFELTRESQLRFIGSSPPDPVLELEAAHQTRAGAKVSVRITGRGSKPVLTFFIDGDEVEAGQAVQELFGGQRGGGDGSDANSQAQSFVSGLTAGVLATAARRELGAAAPIVMIDPADKAGEGRVRAGFELDDIVPPFLRPLVTGVYLEGIVARESEGADAAQTQFGTLLEFYFPRNFFTAGQYGPGSTWSIDFGWQL